MRLLRNIFPRIPSLFALFIGGQTLLRWAYYGDLLPNTYYLKMTGYPALFRIARGLLVLFQFVWQFNWLLFLFPLTLLFFRRDRYVALCFLLVVGQVAYSVYVGGDAWEHKGGSNRYFSIVMPVYFVLFAYAADAVFKALASRLRPDASWTRNLSQLVTTVFVLLAMLQSNALLGEVRDLERWLLLRQPTFVEGNKETVQIALDLAEITRPEATVAVVAAGALKVVDQGVDDFPVGITEDIPALLLKRDAITYESYFTGILKIPPHIGNGIGKFHNTPLERHRGHGASAISIILDFTVKFQPVRTGLRGDFNIVSIPVMTEYPIQHLHGKVAVFDPVEELNALHIMEKPANTVLFAYSRKTGFPEMPVGDMSNVMSERDCLNKVLV